MADSSRSAHHTRRPVTPQDDLARPLGDGSSSIVKIPHQQWDDNGGAIPLWAAFVEEEGGQEYAFLNDYYAPAVLFFRHGGYEFLPMPRPHLDGIRPEWGPED
jgi:hypothetical protein